MPAQRGRQPVTPFDGAGRDGKGRRSGPKRSWLVTGLATIRASIRCRWLCGPAEAVVSRDRRRLVSTRRQHPSGTGSDPQNCRLSAAEAACCKCAPQLAGVASPRDHAESKVRPEPGSSLHFGEAKETPARPRRSKTGNAVASAVRDGRAGRFRPVKPGDDRKGATLVVRAMASSQ